MKMGSMAEVARDDSIAMRLRFDGAAAAAGRDVLPRPGADALRRRRMDAARPALRAGQRCRRGRRRCRPSGAPLRYEVTLEPLRLASVPLLEATTDDRPDRGLSRSSPRDDLQWLADRPVLERVRFKRRRPSTPLRPRRAAPPRRAAAKPRAAGRLQPAHARLGARLSRRSAAPQRERQPARAGGAAAHPHRRLQLHARRPATTAATRIDEFWLDRKEGFCEHFAVRLRRRHARGRRAGAHRHRLPGHRPDRRSTATTSCARARRTPGPSSGRPGTGWVRADPTGAVAPDRIGRSSRLAPQPGFVAGTLDAMSPELLAAPAQRLGGGQQPLEPVGAQLLARPAARRAEAASASQRRAGKTWRCC